MYKSRIIPCIIFLAIFVGMFLSNTLFTHSHIVRGMIIVHSHPYNPFSEKEHQHSDNEIILIAYLANLLLIEDNNQGNTPIYLTPTKFIIKEYTAGKVKSDSILFSLPRDPPIPTIYS